MSRCTFVDEKGYRCAALSKYYSATRKWPFCDDHEIEKCSEWGFCQKGCNRWGKRVRGELSSCSICSPEEGKEVYQYGSHKEFEKFFNEVHEVCQELGCRNPRVICGRFCSDHINPANRSENTKKICGAWNCEKPRETGQHVCGLKNDVHDYITREYSPIAPEPVEKVRQCLHTEDGKRCNNSSVKTVRESWYPFCDHHESVLYMKWTFCNECGCNQWVSRPDTIYGEYICPAHPQGNSPLFLGGNHEAAEKTMTPVRPKPFQCKNVIRGKRCTSNPKVTGNFIYPFCGTCETELKREWTFCLVTDKKEDSCLQWCKYGERCPDHLGKPEHLFCGGNHASPILFETKPSKADPIPNPVIKEMKEVLLPLVRFFNIFCFACGNPHEIPLKLETNAQAFIECSCKVSFLVQFQSFKITDKEVYALHIVEKDMRSYGIKDE